MNFNQLYEDLPFFGFLLVVVYTFLGIMRVKRILRIPLIVMIILLGFIPGIWLALPIFAAFELTMQIMRVLRPYLN